MRDNPTVSVAPQTGHRHGATLSSAAADPAHVEQLVGMFVAALDPRPPLAGSVPLPTSPDRPFGPGHRHAPPARVRLTDHAPTPTALDHEPRRYLHSVDPTAEV
jgi:hypothetical protein